MIKFNVKTSVVATAFLIVAAGAWVYSTSKNSSGSERITFVLEKQDVSLAALKRQAEEMSEALMKSDFEKFEKFTHPDIVRIAGGKEMFIKILKAGTSGPHALVISKVSLGEPSKIIHVGKELQATLPEIIEAKVSEGTLVSRSTLVAFSPDDGEAWYFIDGNKGLIVLQKLLPTLSNELVVPPQEPPVLYEN